jgi:mannose-6-phosphate isomerase
VQPYAWGSRETIARLQGRPVPSPGPEAELWMGAHPSAPSGLERDGRWTTLDAVIAADAPGVLGAQVAARFGGRLPFLLKVLSASKALSIQVHPSRAQAQAGYREENERGLAPGDKGRNYVDDWPKPEILCALTPFEVLAGLRDPADAARFMRELAVPELEPLAALLAGDRADAHGDVRATVLARILSWPAGQREALIRDVVEACHREVDDYGPYHRECGAIIQVASDHPGDLGVVASLLMRHAVLQPGQAVFLPAGGLHAYLHGTGIELLANSDNVVRAGLTGKHIDIPELLKLTDPAVEVPLIAPRDLGNGIAAYDTPAPEFRLYRAALGAGPVTLPGDGPRVVLSVDGTLTLTDAAAGAALKLGQGESAFLSAADATVTAAGPAEAFIATVGG